MARTARQILRSTGAATATVAVAASVAGATLFALPAAAEGRPFDMYDVDGNGLDPYAADTPGYEHPYQNNGHVDQNVITVNGALLWLYDRDEDSRPDAYGTDGNGDGWADLWGYDANEDYVVDSWAYDTAVHSRQTTFVVTTTVVQQSTVYYG